MSALRQPCVRLVSAMCGPCVCLESALAAPPNLVHVSAICALWPRLQTLSALLLCLLPVCPLCARSLSAMCSLFASSGHVSSPLDFVRSWPPVGQGRGIIKYIFSACLLVTFLGIHFGFTNSAFASAPYA